MHDPTRQAEWLTAIRLRYTINIHLEDQGVTTLAAIDAAAGLPHAVAALQAVARRLELEVVLPDTDLLLGKARAW